MSVLDVPAYQDPSALPYAERDAVVITSRLVDGKLVVVSRYGDNVWYLHGQPTNKARADSNINFRALPACFQDTMRAIAYRYMSRGRRGNRRPSDRTVIMLVTDAKPFLDHIARMGLSNFAEITSAVCFSYVEACRRYRFHGKHLKPSSIGHRLCAVEALYELGQSVGASFPEYPWPNDSWTRLAGLTGLGTGNRGGLTPLIPNDVFAELFQKAWEVVKRAPDLLALRDKWLRECSERGQSWSISARSHQLSAFARRNGLSGASEFSRSVLEIRTACYIVVASTSGCRNHELAFIRAGACYSTTSEDETGAGETYRWMRSESTKTGAGHTDWMIPEAAKVAIEVMENWSRPLQLQIDAEVVGRRAANPEDPQIAEAQRHRNAIFLTAVPYRSNEVRTWSGSAVNLALKAFARSYGLQWTLASHQFRRKFANYAARSQFGDLRYLKQHFKHWSMDMTLGYALNEAQEIALYAEIQDELDDLKSEIVESWLRPNLPLAGGYGANVMAWRGSNPVTMFKDHEHMVRSLAESTPIRSNLHSWCTADDDMCVGNDLEKTRCSDCNNAVIGTKHAHFYRGMYSHLKDVVIKCSDIGLGGLQIVKRDLDRCSKVLRNLGEDVEALNNG